MSTFLLGFIIGMIIGAGLVAALAFFRTSDCDDCFLARQAEKLLTEELRRKRLGVVA